MEEKRALTAQTPQEILGPEDQAQSLRKYFSPGRETVVIAITSGKGGVGKTNFTANTAYLLAKMGKKVCILDADLGLANIDVLLGLVPKKTLANVLRGECTMADIVLEGPGGMAIIPASSGLREMANMGKEQQKILADQMAILDGEFDYLFIDTAAGISQQVMAFLAAAPQVILITTPEPTAVTDAYAMVKLLNSEYGKRNIYLVVNMVRRYREGEETAAKLSLVVKRFLGEHINIVHLGSLPYQTDIAISVREQRLYVEKFPDKKFAGILKDICAKLTDFTLFPGVRGGVSLFAKALMRGLGNR